MPKTIPRAAVLGSLHPRVFHDEDREFHEHEIREKAQAWEQTQMKQGKSVGYPREGYQEMLPEIRPEDTKLVSEKDQDLWGRTPDNPVTPPAGMPSDASQARITGLVPRSRESPGVVPAPGLHPEAQPARVRGLE